MNTMTPTQINNLEDLFRFHKDTRIVKHKATRLTAPGENYGSLMLKIDVAVETSAGLDEIHVVAKTVPPDETTQQMFNTEKTFRNEIAFYKEMVPLWQSFQREHGVKDVIDCFPKYYGSRLNLNCDTTRVDSNGVLLLENLKVAGYENVERTQGFDLNAAKLVVRDLAHLHSVALALRLQKPSIFETQVLPYLSPWRVSVDFHYKTKAKLEKKIGTIPELESLKARILVAFDQKLKPSVCREPFATVIHNDCWVNNTMVKFDGTEPVKNKIVDFQECAYASPAKDLVFFLFSSVKNQVLEKHYQELVEWYYQAFVSMLKQLGCDLRLFSFEGLERELDFEARHSQFGHLMFMLYPIFAPKNDKLAECSPADLLEIEPTELHKDKLVFIVQQFAKRKWI